MKKLLSFVLLLSCVASISAQSFTFDYNNTPIEPRDTITVQLKTGFMVALRNLNVTNTSDEEKTVVLSTLEVNPNTMRVLSICTGDQCKDSTVSAPFTVSAGGHYNEILIDFDIPTTLNPGDEGLFAVMISNSRSAYDTASNPYIFIKVVVADQQGIEQAASNNSIAAYPNPAAESLSFHYAMESNDNASLMVFNSLGSCVMTLPLTGNEGSLQVNVNNLPAGVYTYGLRNGNRLSQMQKLIVK